jgi:alkylated DNA repair dioxygenase AlkB
VEQLSIFGSSGVAGDLDATVARVPGLRIVEDWVTPEEHDRLLEVIDARTWNTDLQRRTQHYGWRYDYRARSAVGVDGGELPSWLQRLAERLASEDHFARPAEQVTINEYLPGQGIAAHVDRDRFGPVVASLTLGDAYPLRFERDGADQVDVVPPVRSLALFTGECRWVWRHSIAKRRTDPTAAGRRERRRRVSVTFRTVAR